MEKMETSVEDTGTLTETEKIYTVKISGDKFYMVFLGFLEEKIKLNSNVAKNLLAWLCEHAEYNTGIVELSAQSRLEIQDSLNISNAAITNNLRKLKEHNLISGEKGRFLINPEIFWKGELSVRNKLLQDNDMNIIFKLG